MTVLVTGGAGFIGRPLVRRLRDEGLRIVSFDRVTTGAYDDDPQITEVVGDITDGPGIERVLREYGVTEIVHGAAIVGVTASVAGLAATVQVNISGAVALFEAVGRVGGIRRLVDLSSEETYGDFSHDPIGEDDPARPTSPYGITKYAVERLGNYYADTAGLPYVASRFCWVYGPGFPRHRLPNPWLEDVVAGRVSTLASGGDQRIDFTYVDDAVEGAAQLLLAPTLEHRAYNISAGVAVSIRELADELQAISPEWSAEIGGGNLELAPGVFAADKGALDTSRARNEIGYRPRVGLREGLSRTLASLTPVAR